MISSVLYLFMVSCCLMGKAEWQFSAVNINVSDICKAAIHRLSELEVSDPHLMAYYWDSWGKPSDGILTGHTTFLGYYDECIDLKNTALGDTKYCIYSMNMETNISLTNSPYLSNNVCTSSECPNLVNRSSVIDIKIGVCYPSQCSSTEFATVLSMLSINNVATMTASPLSNKMISYTMKLKNDSSAFCPETNVELDKGALMVIMVCVMLIGLVMVGTTLDKLLQIPAKSPAKLSNATENVKALTNKKKYFNNGTPQNIQKIAKDFLLSFSLYNTIPNLLLTKQSPSTIKGLSAIKIFFNFLIVLHHLHYYTVFTFSPGLTSQNSPHYLYAAFSRYIFQPIVNITFSVDAYFLVSATLSAYLTLKDMEKHKKFRGTYFYISRFFRLSPMYYLFTFISYKLFVHVGQGPMWFSQDYHACKTTWWHNIFYLTNTLPLIDMCMPETWYICTDMQLFLMSPIFIVLLYHSVYYGLIAIAVTMIAASTIVGYVATKNGYWAAILVDPQVMDQYADLYDEVYFRMNTYLTGILLGYILYKKYNIATLPIRDWLKQLMYMVLWGVAVYLCTIPTLSGTYGEYTRTHHFTDFENIIFLMFSGLAWNIGLALIIYICNTGYGGMFNSILSWPGWDPIARLIYGVLLIHMMVMFYVLGTLQSSLRYTDTVFVMITVFTLVISYGLSVVTALCVELPIANVVSQCFKLARMEARSA